MSRHSRQSRHWCVWGLICVVGTTGAVKAAPPVEWAREISTGENGITDLTFSPDGGRIAVASWDQVARICRAEDGEVLHTLRHHETAPVFAVAF